VAPNAGFEGSLRGGRKQAKKTEREGKGRKGRRGTKTTSLEINFWLRPCIIDY